MEATTSAISENSSTNSGSDNESFREAFTWDWYIRLKVQFSIDTDADVTTNLDDISKEFDGFWQSLKSTPGEVEGQLWPTPLIDTSKAYFFLIGLSTLPSAELAKSRQLLKEWQKETNGKRKKKVTSFEAKFVPRKVVLEHGFEVYSPPIPEAAELKTEIAESVLPARTKKEKKKDAFPAAGNFKKIKGSNPAEVRRQFLEHSMKASGSSTPQSNSGSSGKLRPGKEVLNRMKFDEKYDIEDFAVGYIDRKEGILEKSVEEWDQFGQEELMAYIKNVKNDEIVWDKARKVDLVFGRKGGGEHGLDAEV